MTPEEIRMKNLQKEFDSYLAPSVYSFDDTGYTAKTLEPEQANFDFLDEQAVKDNEWKHAEAFYNGSVNMLERTVLGSLTMARDYNIATRRDVIQVINQCQKVLQF